MSAHPLAAVFEVVLGASSLQALRAAVSDEPVILIGGSQLTGKSTAAECIARVLGGEAGSTGGIAREAAAREGLAIEEWSILQERSPGTDVALDYRAAMTVATGRVAVLESRLAGHLCRLLSSLGRRNICSVLLACTPRERALRHLERESSRDHRALVEPRLPHSGPGDLLGWIELVASIAPRDLTERLRARATQVAERDERERARLLKLYGLEPADERAFDAVLRVDGLTPDEVASEVLRQSGRSGAR